MKLAALLLSSALLPGLVADHDAPKVAGIRLEMNKQQVHKILSREAVYKWRDENQEVWSFTHSSSMRSVIVGFAPDNRVRYVTAFARKDGSEPLNCPPLHDLKKAQVSGTPPDAVYTMSWKEHSESFVATARGASEHFTSCSIKKVGAGIEDEDEERDRRKGKS